MSKLAEMFVAQDEQYQNEQREKRLNEEKQKLLSELKELSEKKDAKGHYTEDVANRILQISVLLEHPETIRTDSVINDNEQFLEYMKGFSERRVKG